MRRPASYPRPNFIDPNDLRLVQIIRSRGSAQPRSVNILGIPYDGAVLGRKGAAGGPAAIRQAVSGFSNYNFELDVGLEGGRVFDLGDVVVDSEDVQVAHGNVEEEVSALVRKDSLLVILGGDNSVTLPSLKACSKSLGKLGLIVVDSHLDLRGKIKGKPTSGSSYGLAVENNFVAHGNVVEVGIHGFLNSKTYVKKAKRLGISLIAANEVSRRGAKTVASDAYDCASKGADAVYLSMDLDAVDISQVSGVSAPSVGGISAQHFLDLAYELAKRPKVKCIDLVELAPNLDPTGGTSRVAATALTYAVAGFLNRS